MNDQMINARKKVLNVDLKAKDCNSLNKRVHSRKNQGAGEITKNGRKVC